MKSRLAMQLLGPAKITLDGRPINLNKHTALLVYLAVNGGSTREQIITIFWPEADAQKARQSLRTARSELKRELGEPWLNYEGSFLGLEPGPEVWVDVVEFRRLIESYETHDHSAGEICDDCVKALTAAAALYQGNFMAGFGIRDSLGFDEWQEEQAESIRRELDNVLQLLVDYYEAQGDFEAAIEHARRQLRLDNLRETVHRKLMSLYYRSDRRSDFIRQFEDCRNILAEALGVEPEPATLALFDLLRTTPSNGATPSRPAANMEAAHAHLLPSPYRGLMPFLEDNARFFFGREKFIKRLERAIQNQSLVAVTGPSGSGKSSVVFAGLLSQLRQDKSWTIINFRPGSRPFQALAAALVPQLEPAMSQTDQLVEVGKLAQALFQEEVQLFDVSARLLNNGSQEHRLLLVVDQLEELYTLCPDKETRHRFLDVLLRTTDTEQHPKLLPCKLIMTLRADFLAQASAYRPLADALQDNQTMLGPMNQQELQLAVEQPAQVMDIAFEAGLVERILNDVGDEPGNLPLLEFALDLLWSHQAKGYLTHAGYEKIGRVEGALTYYADTVYTNLSHEQQTQARRIFTQMVQPGAGTEDTRRPTTQEELAELDWPLVQHLANARLVVTNHDANNRQTVEMVHEALIRSWNQLRDWIEQNRDFRLWQERLRINLTQWTEGKSDEDLLSTIHLPKAREWLQKRRDDLSAAEIEFIQRSIIANQRRRRRVGAFRVAFGGLGAAIAAALATALAGYILWDPTDPRFLNLPQSSIVYIFALQGGLLGLFQGLTTALGLTLPDFLLRRPSPLVRLAGGMLGGGVTGGIIFLLLRLAEALPIGLAFEAVFIMGSIMFMLTSGAASLTQLASGMPGSTVGRVILSAALTGVVSFGALWVVFQLVDMSAGDDFLTTALGFAALEGMFGAGLALGLELADRLHYTSQDLR